VRKTKKISEFFYEGKDDFKFELQDEKMIGISESRL
jgi:hypothetical protein